MKHGVVLCTMLPLKNVGVYMLNNHRLYSQLRGLYDEKYSVHKMYFDLCMLPFLFLCTKDGSMKEFLEAGFEIGGVLAGFPCGYRGVRTYYPGDTYDMQTLKNNLLAIHLFPHGIQKLIPRLATSRTVTLDEIEEYQKHKAPLVAAAGKYSFKWALFELIGRAVLKTEHEFPEVMFDFSAEKLSFLRSAMTNSTGALLDAAYYFRKAIVRDALGFENETLCDYVHAGPKSFCRRSDLPLEQCVGSSSHSFKNAGFYHIDIPDLTAGGCHGI